MNFTCLRKAAVISPIFPKAIFMGHFTDDQF